MRERVYETLRSSIYSPLSQMSLQYRDKFVAKGYLHSILLFILNATFLFNLGMLELLE